jgi:hypothetical protein
MKMAPPTSADYYLPSNSHNYKRPVRSVMLRINLQPNGLSFVISCIQNKE